MSEFNYPIQIDETTYSKTIGDYDYNRIFDYLTDNTDWKATLDKLSNNLKLGIIDSNLNRKAYDFSLLLKYFNNLSNYCRKATTTERNNMYCNFITCLESSFVCRNNPQIIRDLADLLCINPPITCGLTKIDDTSVYYKSETHLFNLSNFVYDDYIENECYSYNFATFAANYYENTGGYLFKDTELLLIGTGLHFFYFDRRISRTIYFLIDATTGSYNKQLQINLMGYVGGEIDLLDPLNIPNLYTIPYDQSIGEVFINSIEIIYDSNTDITTHNTVFTTIPTTDRSNIN